jgi:hypothetical protein
VQIGAENRKKVMWAGGLGAVALLIIAYQLFSSPSAPVTAAQPASPGAARPAARRITAHGKKERAATEARLDPTLDLDLLAETEKTKYSGSGRNIFVAQAEVIPPPIAPVKLPESSGPPQPPPPPPPPAINLKYFGFANKPGEPKKAFLSQGEDVFIAVEGEIVDRRYKVIRIGPTSVEVEDVLYNNRQSIPLTQGPQG